MKIILFLLLFASTSLYGFSQSSVARKVVDVDNNNTNMVVFNSSRNYIFPPDKYVRVVKGSPFLTDGWMKSNYHHPVTKKPILMRLDLVANQTHYLEDDKILVLSTTLKNLSLTDTVADIHYNFIHSNELDVEPRAPEGWYQEIAKGKVTFYKVYQKLVHEIQPYGQATYEQRIENGTDYYIIKDRSMYRVRKIKDIAEVLNDKPKEVQSFIAVKNLKERKEEDLISLINMYNQLF